MAPLSRFPPPVTSRHRGRRAIITGGSFGGARHRMPIGIQICSGTEWSPAERVSGCSRRPQRRQPPRAHAEIARLKFHLARYRRAEFGRSSEKLARDTEQPELALEPGAFRPCAHARRRGCQVRARLAAGGKWIRTLGPTCGRGSLCGERDGNSGSSTGPARDCWQHLVRQVKPLGARRVRA